MILQREKFIDVIAEVLPLARDNYDEVEEGGMPFDLAIGYITQAEEEGQAVVFTARIGGELVAYSLFLLTYTIHSKTTRQAINDVFYVKPEHRGRVAVKLFDYAEERLKELGVPVIVYNCKTKLDWSSLLARRGFQRIETVWRKVVGE